MKIFRWIGENLATVLLAFILAIVVWGSAVVSANPNQESELTIPLNVVGQPSNTVIVDPIPEVVTVQLVAPQSVIEEIRDEGLLRATADITGLEAGTYRVPVQITIPEGVKPIRVLDRNPKRIQLTLDNLVQRELPITKDISGDPAIGYKAGPVEWSADTVVVSGRQTQVEQVSTVRADLDISDADETISTQVDLVPLDGEGNLVQEVSLQPQSVEVNQTITLQGGYRNVAVNVITEGKVAPGYRMTNITPNPPTVMVFSENPQLVEELPGYVNTMPLDLTDVDDYTETILELDLPQGVTVVGDPTVLVQVNVTTIKNDMNITREVEVIGLLPGYRAEVLPQEVDIRVYGPVPTLENLTQRDVRVIVDLSDLEEGVHSVTPTIEILPNDITLETIQPDSIEVTIEASNQPTPEG